MTTFENGLRERAFARGLSTATITYVLRTHPPTLAALVDGAVTVPAHERAGRTVGPTPAPGFKAPHWQTKWGKSCLLCGGDLRKGDRLDRTPLADSGARFPHAICARAQRAATAQRRAADADAARRRRTARKRRRETGHTPTQS